MSNPGHIRVISQALWNQTYLAANICSYPLLMVISARLRRAQFAFLSFFGVSPGRKGADREKWANVPFKPLQDR
jgi:hypothetical protein